MTTIAYRDGIIAADTGLTGGTGTRSSHVSKIARSERGELIGLSGGLTRIRAYIDWFLAGEAGERPSMEAPGEETDTYVALVVRRGGQMEWHDRWGIAPYYAPYEAAGSGTDVALGAMHAGASAGDAVCAAIEHDNGTWGRVETLELGKRK